jgi:AAA15 family ATPase/GTPase
MNVSKVVSSTSRGGEWVSPDGKTYYPSEYEFEDGVTGDALHETVEPKFKQGDEVAYEIKKTVNGKNSIRVQDAKYIKNKQGRGQNQQSKPVMNHEVQDQIMRQTCVKASAEFYAQRGDGDHISVVKFAEYLYQYCKTGIIKTKGDV